MAEILTNQLFVLFAVIAVGYAIGLVKVYGVSFGNSACLFSALAAGALGATISPVITDLGIIFFVYSVGLQAGPYFFHLFNKRGLKYSFLALFTVVISGAVVMTVSALLHLDTAAMVGSFAGALTSTPTLASAVNALSSAVPSQVGVASLAFMLAYPFALVVKVLFVQIMPKIYSKRIRQERQCEAVEKELRGLKCHPYKLSNANLAGKTLSDLDLHDFCRVNLGRVKRGKQIFICGPDTRFELGDTVMAVGTQEELDKFKLFFGEETTVEFRTDYKTQVRDIFVSSSKFVGKNLRELEIPENYGVTITRVRRGEIEITPTADFVLEIGDVIKVVGSGDDVENLASVVGSEKRKLDETNVLILALGMLVGTILGEIPLEIGDFRLTLGVAGGPLLVALVLSHFGKVGRLSVRVPNATKFFIRELGLVFFLTGTGIKAGGGLSTIIYQHNIMGAMLAGPVTTILTLVFSFFFINKFFGVPVESSLGAVCGSTTSTPALGILMKTLDSDIPTISYAAAYPVAMIVLTIMGQILVWLGLGLL